MALAAINVKKPREAQIWNCCTGNPVLRILPDSNVKVFIASFAHKYTMNHQSTLSSFQVSKGLSSDSSSMNSNKANIKKISVDTLNHTIKFTINRRTINCLCCGNF